MPSIITHTAKPTGKGADTSGFTLIELLVVISIIALLVGILLPALGAARKSAKKAQCLSQLRQIATGIVNYTGGWDDRLPLIPGFGRQGEQIEMLDTYMSTSKDIYICPSALDTDTAGELWDPPARSANFLGNGTYESKFSGQAPLTPNNAIWGTDVSGDVISYHTDYKLNDYSGDFSKPNNLNNGDGIIDRMTVQLPITSWTVLAVDIDWGRPPIDGNTSLQDGSITRHNGGENLAFLDGHARFYTRDEYSDENNGLKDKFGNQIWYKWGDPDPDDGSFTELP